MPFTQAYVQRDVYWMAGSQSAPRTAESAVNVRQAVEIQTFWKKLIDFKRGPISPSSGFAPFTSHYQYIGCGFYAFEITRDRHPG